MTARPNTFIDAELAREVMGWSIVQAGEEEWLEKAILRGERTPIFAYWSEGGTMVVMDAIDITKTRDFRPTSDVAHAMELIDELRQRQYKVVIATDGGYDGTEWKVEIYHPLPSLAADVETDPDNLPLAISKAVLKAVRRKSTPSP